MIYLFLVCMNIGNGYTLIDIDEGFYTYEQCMESIKTIGDEAYCVSKYIDL